MKVTVNGVSFDISTSVITDAVKGNLNKINLNKKAFVTIGSCVSTAIGGVICAVAYDKNDGKVGDATIAAIKSKPSDVLTAVAKKFEKKIDTNAEEK